MIRDRRDEDLERLIDVLGELDDQAGILARRPRDWLQEVEAECSWVFDQAPVRVAPTKNVVGHVQIYRPRHSPWADDVIAHTGRQFGDLLVIGRLFVKPVKHDYGIARYLLKEAVRYVESRGRLAMLDPASLAFAPDRCAQSSASVRSEPMTMLRISASWSASRWPTMVQDRDSALPAPDQAGSASTSYGTDATRPRRARSPG